MPFNPASDPENSRNSKGKNENGKERWVVNHKKSSARLKALPFLTYRLR